MNKSGNMPITQPINIDKDFALKEKQRLNEIPYSKLKQKK
jgi:hypothetical protein